MPDRAADPMYERAQIAMDSAQRLGYRRDGCTSPRSKRVAVMPIGNVAKVCASAKRTPRQLAQILVKGYQWTLSPFLGSDCRHLPTCSEYADEALERFGLWGGGWMTCARLCRCHPFGSSGLDFVPRALPPLARWYIPWRYGRWRGTHNPYQCGLLTPEPD